MAGVLLVLRAHADAIGVCTPCLLSPFGIAKPDVPLPTRFMLSATLFVAQAVALRQAAAAIALGGAASRAIAVTGPQARPLAQPAAPPRFACQAAAPIANSTPARRPRQVQNQACRQVGLRVSQGLQREEGAQPLVQRL